VSLLEDDFVLVLRKDHPAAENRGLSMEKFAALSHIQSHLSLTILISSTRPLPGAG